ncbi:MAG: hypothetical protein JSW28_08615 [Thermoplasmata archaeon]|nr:MAG: hypothetical protein JSW28_08615 [Thermoplasmata archaeon]
MNRKVEDKKNVDLKDYAIRNLKWTWPYLAFFLTMVALLIALIDIEHDLVLNVILFMFALSIVIMIYSFFHAVKTIVTAKRVSYVNNKKSLVLIIIIFLLFFILFLETFLVPPRYAPAFIFELVILGFLSATLINLRHEGSISDWYNNIIVRYGRRVKTLDDGYTERPYTTKLIDLDKIDDWGGKLREYGEVMEREVLLAGYERIGNGIIFYLPTPSIMVGIVGGKRDIEKSTRITVYKDGNLSVYISKKDYDQIGLEITYHELCHGILEVFSNSIKAFLKGDVNQAIEIVGGKDHLRRRKIEFRKRIPVYIRIAAVLTIINIFLNIGPLSQEYIGTQDSYSNGPHVYSPEWGAEIEAYHSFFGIIGVDEPQDWDEFLIRFSANTTLPKVYVTAYLEDIFENVIVSEVMENVSFGEFHIKAKEKYYGYRFVIELTKVRYDIDENLIPATINITVKHLNGYSVYNNWVVLLTIIIFVPIEIILKLRRKSHH